MTKNLCAKIKNTYKQLRKSSKLAIFVAIISGIAISNPNLYAQNIRNNQENNALIIFSNPKKGNNEKAIIDFHKKGYLDLIKNHYNAFVDTVTTRKEFYESFEKSVIELEGLIDLYIGLAHIEDSTGIILGEEKLSAEQIETGVSLEKYFNERARGVQFSCYATNKKIKIAQALANSCQIPIESFDISLSPHIKIEDEKIVFAGRDDYQEKGFSEFGYGFFETKSTTYCVCKEKIGQTHYFIFKSQDENPKEKYWNEGLPLGFENDKLYHNKIKIYQTVEVLPEQ
ncbi:MAG: hypothetical protein ABIC91_03480 [Nanoarchaeota archaeon]